MPTDFSTLRINTERFKEDFETMASIGATKAGGIKRPAFSKAHFQAREWFRDTSIERGLSFCIDDAGNHIANLDCLKQNASTLLLGSHLDSVPHGGKYDGALGVIAGLEVLSTIKDNNLQLPFNLAVIDFTDEEGTYVGFLGSSYMAGKLTASELENPRSSRQLLMDGLSAAGLTEENLLHKHHKNENYVGYLELHVEQGSRLIESEIDIGLVTSIAGICSYNIVFIGQENHAGTTSMQTRQDASRGVSDFLLDVHEIVLKDFPSCTANIGNIKIDPGAFNIIPARATASLEYRAPNKAIFGKLDTVLINAARNSAIKYNLDFEIELLAKHDPVQMDHGILTCFQKSTEILGLGFTRLSSGAGHDAQYMASICPSGMIFIPSINGISHSPQEFSRWKDCINGTNVLLQAVLQCKEDLINI